MNLIKLKVKTGNQKYPIFIGNNIIGNLSKFLRENLISFNQCLIVVDKNVPKRLIKKVLNSLLKKKITLHHFNSSEKNKNQKNIFYILSFLLNHNFNFNFFFFLFFSL